MDTNFRRAQHSGLVASCDKSPFAEHEHLISSYVKPRNPPFNDADAILRLSASLTQVSCFLKDLLSNGFPKKGRSQDDKESYEQWWEDRNYAYFEAIDSLRLVREYEDSRQAEVKESKHER
jgi:hypothetical protein